MQDPNPVVAGRGFRKLRKAGIVVETGLLEDKARRLNEKFIVNIALGRPLVILKAAVTLDGSLGGALAKGGQRIYITGEKSARKVHSMRRDSDAVLVGSGTLLADNPELTARKVKGRNPLRIILDGRLCTPPDARVVELGASDGKTFIFHGEKVDPIKKKRLGEAGAELVEVKGPGMDPAVVLDVLRSMGIGSVLLEGGRGIFGSFIARGVVDRVSWFIAPKFAAASDPPGFHVVPSEGDVAWKTGAIGRIGLVNVHWYNMGDDVMMDGYTREHLEEEWRPLGGNV